MFSVIHFHNGNMMMLPFKSLCMHLRKQGVLLKSVRFLLEIGLMHERYHYLRKEYKYVFGLSDGYTSATLSMQAIGFGGRQFLKTL